MSRKGLSYFRRKNKLLTTMPKGYIDIWIHFSFCWMVVGDGGYSFAWWWVVIDIFWLVVGDGGWWWQVA